MTDDSLTDILAKHLDIAFKDSSEDYRFKMATQLPVSTMLSAMREAVEKGSIGFAEWMARNDWECVGVIDDERYWAAEDGVAIVTDSVYKEYLKTL